MIGAAVRALLAGVVDYAGLFPPAGLDMRAAVANYARYLASEDAWALGRFVVPAARLEEFAAARAAQPALGAAAGEWRLSAVLSGESSAELERVRQFNRARAGQAVVDVVEAKLPTKEAIAAAGTLARGLEAFVEVPVREDPQALLSAVCAAGMKAKIRMGGLSAEAFPAPDEIVRFIRRCREVGVPFKATAGLHHPLRGSYPLTYEPNAAFATMYGFLNVLLATALVDTGADDARVIEALEAGDLATMRVADDTVIVAGMRVAAADLRRVRERGMVAFGSCSFREPMDELRAAGLL